MTRKKVQRCTSCNAVKGKLHSPKCRREDRALYPNGVTYTASYDTGSSSSYGGCDTSSSDGGGSSCGSAC